MRNALRHVDLGNCRSTRCAHTARIDEGEATSPSLPNIPRSHLHLALKHYQFLDDFSSSHSLNQLSTVFTLLEPRQGGGVYPPPAIALKKASMPSCLTPRRLFLSSHGHKLWRAHMTFKPNVHTASRLIQRGLSSSPTRPRPYPKTP